jgi:hypothetical protein
MSVPFEALGVAELTGKALKRFLAKGEVAGSIPAVGSSSLTATSPLRDIVFARRCPRLSKLDGGESPAKE